LVCIIDFDKTLLKNDFFKEIFYRTLLQKPFKLINHFLIKRSSILELKNELLINFNLYYPVQLLFNPIIINWINENKSNYEKIIIVSASPHFFVKDVLKSLDFINEIHGSTDINLKGKNKLDYIMNKWGSSFDYLGDSKSDNIIFKNAKNGFLITRNELIHVKK
jgi:2-hydroxy-3-keto-5-methylthiopentenyl-1-phosphate phosphatase